MQALNALSTANSWNNLNQKLEELTKSNRAKEAGDIFENLCKYFLETDSKYRTKLKKVWLLKEVKEDLRRKLNLPSTDEGIDLIAETFEGKYWAIQSKYRSDPKDTLTVKGDLATFANLAFNNCKNISLGLVMTTADKPPLKTKLLKRVTFITLESFLELDDNNLEGWNLIKAKTEGKIVVPKALSPRPHQIKAIDETIKYFKTKERGKVIMPCGTGKSLTAFWIANELKARSILISVPSLALLQQTLKVWTREYLIAGVKPDWLCVCSDQTVSDDQDDFVSNIYELGIDVTTDKNEIKKFLKSKSNIKVVFTTYQSGKVTASGAKGFTFDLGIMDEAHKTVGLGTKPMAHLIHQKNIKIKHRLFMTATERLFKGDKEEYLSMDDPRDYGDLIYQLSFKEAIEEKPPIIADYKIITFGISEPEIEAVYQDNKFIQIKKEIDDIKAREFATALALRKAIKKLGIKNAISFHSSIRRANNFKAQQELISKVYPEYGNLKAFHVSGDMPTNQRSSQMREFAESKGLMTNARCLTEGVDLPAIDCVVFTDPKKSKVDIVQAAGRALRLSPGKKFGYILIPLIIPENENATEAAKDTAFEEIVATIRALATQDTRIVEYLRAVSSGIIPKGGSPVDGITKINVLTKVNEEEFNKSIQLKVWDRVAFGNPRSYEEATKIVKRLKIKSAKNYHEYKKLNKLPLDLPWGPPATYRDKGWTSWGDFLGTGFISSHLRNYRTYEKSRRYARALKLDTVTKWKEHTRLVEFPKDIPAIPKSVYKNWKGWTDFLGTEIVAAQNKKYRSFVEARKFARSLKLNSVKEWINFCRSKKRPHDIHQNPHKKYKNQFKSYDNFLNITILNKKRNWMSFYDAKKLLKSKKIKTGREYKNFIKNNKIINLPTNPAIIYQKDWVSLGDYLGTDYIAHQYRKYKSYYEAKLYIQSKKINSRKEFQEKIKQKKISLEIPLNPQTFYKNKGWVNWGDFLGLKFHNKRNYTSFSLAKEFMNKLNIQSQNEFKNYMKENEEKFFRLKIPHNPPGYYPKSIWKGWKDFFGKNEYLPYDKAKKIVRKAKLPNTRAWRNYCKNEKIKEIPYQPNKIYKKKGWVNWGEFLGTGRVVSKDFKSFNDSKRIVRKLKITGRVMYAKFVKKNKIGLPYKPYSKYKSQWKGWDDYLGVQVRKRNNYANILSYKKAKDYLKNKNFSFKDWMKFIRERDFPNFLPRYPKEPYKKQWKGWPDFLGTGRKPRSKKNK